MEAQWLGPITPFFLSAFRPKTSYWGLIFCVLLQSPALANQTAKNSPELPPVIEKAPIVLGRGEQRLLRLPGLVKYSIGDPLIRVHPFSVNDALLIKGVQAGTTDLWVWKSDGAAEHRIVRVEIVASSDVKPAIERAVGKLEETDIVFTGSGVILRGEIRTAAEASRISALTSGFPTEIFDQTKLSDELIESGRSKLVAWITKNKLDRDLRVERRGDSIWVRGSLEHSRDADIIGRQLRGVFPKLELELLALSDDAPTVYFKVFLLELKRNRFSTFGLDWPANQEGAFQVTTSGIQDLLQLNLTLQTLAGDGSLRILSNPELVVRAPGDAELFSGGELPIYTSSVYHSEVTWKTFGLTLKLKVVQTTGARVRVDISTEVSQLDPTLMTDNKIPGIQSNRMTTQVDARYGVPLLLSGLLQENMHESARGLPLLREIPILGALFGSDDYQNERSELVAVLLPDTAPPPAPMHRVKTGPRGDVPTPRNWVSPQEEDRLRSSPDYPFNALE